MSRFVLAFLMTAGVCSQAAVPEAGDDVGFTELVGYESEHGVDTAGPEFLGALHSPVNALDGRFDIAAGGRQPLAAVLGIVHPRALVGDIAERLGYLRPRRPGLFLFRQA